MTPMMQNNPEKKMEQKNRCLSLRVFGFRFLRFTGLGFRRITSIGAQGFGWVPERLSVSGFE